MGYIYWDGYWLCHVCLHVNPPEDISKCACGRERTYEMTYPEAHAVARRLNSLEAENKTLSAMLAASTLYVAKLGRQLEDADWQARVDSLFTINDLRRQLIKAELRTAELQGRLDGIAYHWQAIKKGAIENQANCAMIIGRIEQIAYLACGPQTKAEEGDGD